MLCQHGRPSKSWNGPRLWSSELELYDAHTRGERPRRRPPCVCLLHLSCLLICVLLCYRCFYCFACYVMLFKPPAAMSKQNWARPRSPPCITSPARRDRHHPRTIYIISTYNEIVDYVRKGFTILGILYHIRISFNNTREPPQDGVTSRRRWSYCSRSLHREPLSKSIACDVDDVIVSLAPGDSANAGHFALRAAAAPGRRGRVRARARALKHLLARDGARREDVRPAGDKRPCPRMLLPVFSRAVLHARAPFSTQKGVQLQRPATPRPGSRRSCGRPARSAADRARSDGDHRVRLLGSKTTGKG